MGTISQFHFHTLAIVAVNKLRTSKIIEATPIEHTSFVNGEITDTYTNIIAFAKDANNKNYGTSVKSSITIEADWLPIGNSNRMTAPDVRRGETVIIYRFADTDKYYWNVFTNDMSLRKLETVIYAFSGTTVEADPTDASTSYYMEVSTHDKYVHLHTSNTNGEPYQYDIQINTATGFIQIMDDQGNYIKFDTTEHQISLVNQDGSVVEVNKTNINLSCTDTTTINCANLVVNANSAITATSPTTTVNSTTVNNGHTTINGGLDVH